MAYVPEFCVCDQAMLVLLCAINTTCQCVLMASVFVCRCPCITVCLCVCTHPWGLRQGWEPHLALTRCLWREWLHTNSTM